jgi:hypothetical protein
VTHPTTGPVDESPEARQAAAEAWPEQREALVHYERSLTRRIHELTLLPGKDPSQYRSGSPARTARQAAVSIVEDAQRLIRALDGGESE